MWAGKSFRITSIPSTEQVCTQDSNIFPYIFTKYME